MGATGDSELYEPYLAAIGAVQGASDAVFGSMDWCPITNLDTADEAYEWMMGCTRSGLSEDEQAISDALADAYATYVNEAQIPGADGQALTDSLGTDAKTRLEMYTPLYYLLASQGGYGQSTPAKHWRIRTGINQGDTALTCELNLALAAQAHPEVESVDFATVWGQGHTQAERTGSASENFISWVESCTA